MYLTSMTLKHWRNFKKAETRFAPVSHVIGPNASGKSNLLDVFRFLRDLSKAEGGGLQQAVKHRGGIPKVRCLHARKDKEIRIDVTLSGSMDSPTPAWRYELGFKAEGKGAQRILVSHERVWKGDDETPLLARPDKDDERDDTLLTETHLEQTRANAAFRPIADFFSTITYLHLVPQLLKYGDQIGGNRLENDPFGQSFLERIAACSARTRDARLRKIEKVLSVAVPQFQELRFVKDEITGRPHLEARHEHFRPNAGWLREDHFSDGTLRLLGILWSLLEGDSLLLIEEPELSLHLSVVERLPSLIQRIRREAKHRRQVIISTHSEAILRDRSIDASGVMILDPGREGTVIRPPSEAEFIGLEAGLSVADAILPQTRPGRIEQLSLW